MSRLGTWEPAGDADPSRVRRALAFDALIALAVAMLVWPFPLMRAYFPWSVHVPALLAFIVLVEWVYALVCIAVWGRTPVMYLLDLGLRGAERPFGVARASAWALGFTLAVLSLCGAFGTADPARGLPARTSGLETAAV